MNDLSYEQELPVETPAPQEPSEPEEAPAETQETPEPDAPTLSPEGRRRMMEATPDEPEQPPEQTDEPEPPPEQTDEPEPPPEQTDEPEPPPEETDEPLTRAEKGEIGERAMIQQAEAEGRHVLVDHRDNPNAHGFDGIMWDPQEQHLYICEAKNYKDGATIGEGSLSAFEQNRVENNREAAIDAITSSTSIPEEEKIAALQALRDGNFTTELWAPADVNISESAGERMAELGGDISVHTYDDRALQEQERLLREGKR